MSNFQVVELIERLKRVPLKFKFKLGIYYCKRLLNLSYDVNIHCLNSFLTTHLVKYNGYLIEVNNLNFSADFSDANGHMHRFTMRLPPSTDYAVYDQIFGFGEYDTLISLIENYIYTVPDRTLNVIDAGGNIGAFTILFHKNFPNSRFAIIEPDKSNVQILNKNLAQNNIDEFKILLGGVWCKDTYLKTHRDFRDGGDWAVRVSESETTTEVKAFTIQTIMQLVNFDKIDILKIDIEGAEKELFINHIAASEFLAKTKFIAIEIHDEFNCREEIINLLEKNNFDIVHNGESTFGVNRSLVKSLY